MRYIRLVMIMVLLLVGLTGCGSKQQPNIEVTTEEYNPYATAKQAVVVIRDINLEEGTMSFLSVDDGKQYDLLYNNGVDVRNKYDGIMSGTMLSVGQIVDITYSTENNKLLEIAIDKDAWEVQDISGFTFDRAKRQAVILNRTYQYTSDLVIYSGGKLIGTNEVCREDQLTARGYGGKLISLTVDLGHGYVKLEDYDTYIGGMVEIGYDVIVPVTENMLLTVREGNYKLKITRGESSGYKSVAVLRDQEQTVSLKELQIAPASIGTIYFDVSPAEARVMIDGETINTEEAQGLTYGRHHIRITADGYEKKDGYFSVNSAYRIMTIELARTDGSSDTGSTDNTSKNTAETNTADNGNTSESEQGTTENISTSTNNTSTASTESSTSTTETSSSAVTTTEDTIGPATEEANISVSTGYEVTIEQPIGAYCYVDGAYVGTVPCIFSKTIGTHVITLSMRGCYTKSYTIQCIDNGKDDQYSFDALKPYEAVLFE